MIKLSKLFLTGLALLMAISCSKSGTDDEPSKERFIFSLVNNEYTSLVGAGDFSTDSIFIVTASTSDTVMPISIHDIRAGDSLKNPDYRFYYMYYESDSAVNFSFEHIGPASLGPMPHVYYLVLNDTDVDTITVRFNSCEAKQPTGKSEGICVSFNNSIAPVCDTCTQFYLDNVLLFIK